MTIYVNESNLVVNIAINQPNLEVRDNGWFFIITDQYSHQVTNLGSSGKVLYSNDRYSMLQVTFPVGFGDAHKNGIYYYELNYSNFYPIERGLVKIITNPGGEINTISYDSGVTTEERVSDVFYRPQYT